MDFYNASGIRIEPKSNYKVLIFNADPKGNNAYHDIYKFYIPLFPNDLKKIREFISDEIYDVQLKLNSRVVKVYIDNYRFNQYMSPLIFNKDTTIGLSLNISRYNIDDKNVTIIPIHNTYIPVYFDSISEMKLMDSLFS